MFFKSLLIFILIARIEAACSTATNWPSNLNNLNSSQFVNATNIKYFLKNDFLISNIFKTLSMLKKRLTLTNQFAYRPFKTFGINSVNIN
jgi:hypothetical protein